MRPSVGAVVAIGWSGTPITVSPAPLAGSESPGTTNTVSPEPSGTESPPNTKTDSVMPGVSEQQLETATAMAPTASMVRMCESPERGDSNREHCIIEDYGFEVDGA